MAIKAVVHMGAIEFDGVTLKSEVIINVGGVSISTNVSGLASTITPGNITGGIKTLVIPVILQNFNLVVLSNEIILNGAPQ